MLDQIGNKNIFKVPEGYFEQLEDKIIAKTQPIQAKQRILWPDMIKYAAAILLIAVVVQIFFLKGPVETVKPQVAYTEEELIMLVEAGLLSEEELIYQLDGSADIFNSILAEEQADWLWTDEDDNENIY